MWTCVEQANNRDKCFSSRFREWAECEWKKEGLSNVQGCNKNISYRKSASILETVIFNWAKMVRQTEGRGRQWWRVGAVACGRLHPPHGSLLSRSESCAQLLAHITHSAVSTFLVAHMLSCQWLHLHYDQLTGSTLPMAAEREVLTHSAHSC